MLSVCRQTNNGAGVPYSIVLRCRPSPPSSSGAEGFAVICIIRPYAGGLALSSPSTTRANSLTVLALPLRRSLHTGIAKRHYQALQYPPLWFLLGLLLGFLLPKKKKAESKPHIVFPTEKLKTPSDPHRQPAILVSCGSFSPVTLMHLRLMEMVRDHFNDHGYEIIGGYFSPVGDAYGKVGLETAEQRTKMVELAILSSDWLMVDKYEVMSKEWIPTLKVLERFDREINRNRSPDSQAVKVIFVCGSDLLDSFNKPGVWDKEDIINICTKYGIGVLTREGVDPEAVIWSNDLLYSLRNHIHIIHQWIPNDISSTRVRRALTRGLSVKYLVPDPVLEYIKEHKLFRS